jgi:formate dehydrogenase subunit gamma
MQDQLEVQAPATPWVLRFTRTERAAHWLQAATFLTLLATGLIIGTSSLEGLVGHRALLREIHLWSAFFFVFGPTLIALAGNRASVAETVHEVDEWTADDAAWLAHPTLEPDRYDPPAGRFNAGQKLNAIFTAYSTVAFALTGLIIWQNRRFPFDVVSQANTIHTTLAYVALVVFLGHIYLAALHPSTRQALHGMLFGTVDRSWAVRHHARWQISGITEASITLRSALQAALFLVLGSAATLLLVRFGLEWLGANTTDPVTSAIYDVTNIPGTSGSAATGRHVFDLGALIWGGLIAVIGLAAVRRGAA